MSKPAPMKGKGHHNKVQTAANTKNDGKKKDDDSSFVYNLGILIGCVAEIETRGGEKFEGVLSAFTNQALKIMIEAAHEPNGDDESSITKHYDLLIVPADKVSVIKFRNAELTYATRDFQTDAVIGATRQVNVGNKELTPWEGADEVGETLELDSTNTQNGWEAEEMFKENEEKYGVISSFSKDLSGYTTQLDKTDADSFKKHEEAAAQIAQEIEGNTASWERTTVENGDDEEDKFSAVRRPSRNNSNNSNNNPPPPSTTSSSSGTYVCPSRRPQTGNIQGQGHSVNNNGPPSINNNNGNPRKLPYDGSRNNFGAGSTHAYHPRNFDNPPGRGRGHPQYPNARDRREDGNRPHRMANKPPMDRDRNRAAREAEQVKSLKQFGDSFRLHDGPNRMRMPQNQAQHSGPPLNAHINTSAATGNNASASTAPNIRNPSPPNNNSALQISSTQSPAKPNNKKEEFSPVPPLIQSSGPASTNSEISSGSGTDSPHSSSNPTNANSASPSPNMSSSSMNQTTNETTPSTPGSTESQSSAIVSSDSKGSTEAENKLKKNSFVFNPNAKEFVFNPAAKPYTPQRSPSTPPRPPSTPASTQQIMSAPLHPYMPLPLPHQTALLYAPQTTYTTHAQAALTPSSNSSASSGGNTPRHSHRTKGIISGPPRSDIAQPMQMASGPPILAAPASIQTAAPQQFAYVQAQNGTFQPLMRVVNPNMIPVYQTEGSGGTHMHQSMHYLPHNGGTPQSNAGHQQATTPQSNPNAPTSNVSANGHAYGHAGANHGPPHHMGFPFVGVPMMGVSYPQHGQHPATHVLTAVPYVTQGGGNSGIQHSQ